MCYGWVRRLPTSQWMSAGTVQCAHDRTNLLHTAKCWVYGIKNTLCKVEIAQYTKPYAHCMDPHTLTPWGLISVNCMRSRTKQVAAEEMKLMGELQGRLADRGQMWIWAVFWSPNLRKASKRKNLRPTQINSQSHSSQRSNLPLVG